jgi:hypothetical protein
MFVDQRRQPSHICRVDLQAFGPQLIESRIQIHGKPRQNIMGLRHFW